MKPLSEKSLQKKYIRADINEQESKLLHKYFLCFSYLYGEIQIEDLWDIFKTYKENISKLKFYDFADIVQRETNEYSVFDLCEVYSGETDKSTSEKILMNNVLIKRGSSKFWLAKQLNAYINYNNGPYVPSKNELFEFDHDSFYDSNEGKEMKNFISNLKTSGIEKNKYRIDFEKEMVDLDGNLVKDKCLKDFIYITDKEKFDIKYYTKFANQLTLEYSIDSASKVLNYIEKNIMIMSINDLSSFLQYAIDYICYDFGVNMSQEQLTKFVDMYMKLYNAANRWNNFGWSGNELLKRHSINGPIELRMGPNIKKMIENGEYDMDELEDSLKEEGISVVKKKVNISEEQITEENKKYLDIFEKDLEKQGYKEHTIEEHISNVDFYINDYLIKHLPKPMQDGCSLEVISFIETIVNEIVIPSSVFNIDKFLNSILLFYKCMSESGYVSKQEYEECKKIVNSSRDEMVEDYYDKNPEPITIEKITELIEQSHGFGSAYININTGQSEFVPEDEGFYYGDIDELYARIDGPNWRKLPDFRDYDVMTEFALSLKNQAQSDKLYQILHNKKAYRNFKDAIYGMGIEDEYYDLYNQKIMELAESWMREGINDCDEFDDCDDYDDYQEVVEA